jgi:hypothetical protein
MPVTAKATAGMLRKIPDTTAIHRHLGAVEAAMKGRGDKAGCPADEFVGRARKQSRSRCWFFGSTVKTFIRLIMPFDPL